MRRKTGPATVLLRPVLDMYMDAPVALVGCHSKGLERESCEMDVVIVTNDRRPPVSVKMGGIYLDLNFVPEREAMSPLNPEHSMSMAIAKPVRDSGLLLSTSTAANSAVFAESAKKAAETRLGSALKILGRVEDALAKDSVREADLWLLAASYEFAYAWMFSREKIPSPSHLLYQLREVSKGSPEHFNALSKAAGLEKATRVGCGSRLDGLVVLHDVIQSSPHGRGKGASTWSKARLDMVRAKAQELATGMELAECYSFMGQEIVDHLMALTTRGQKGGMTVEEMFSGESPLLGDRLLRGLGLSRTTPALKSALASLREQVSTLARSV